jgi:hypothetical protein
MKRKSVAKRLKRSFYLLCSPCEEPHQVYGKPEWWSRFGSAEWSEEVGGLSTGRLRPPYGQAGVDLAVVLPTPKIGDFVWAWYGCCIATDGTLSLFRHAGFTGFEARPVTVERIERLSRKHREEVSIPPLWELLIQGKGGDAAPESGIYPLCEVEESGTVEYSSFRNGIVVDENNWDGSDFFTVNGYPKFVLVSDRVKELIIGHQLTNCALIPSHKLEWGSDIRPEVLLEKTRARASRDLESLLADLENPDESSLTDTIRALAHKEDPRAVDALIRKFDHPDPFVWYAAADAVAAIVRQKSLPEQVREEVFSKLKDLLGHDDSGVRKCAVMALGYVQGERAAQEIMRSFQDPDESVRTAGAFMITHLRYKPAFEAVTRLTRDRSKRVRDMARKAVIELSAACP